MFEKLLLLTAVSWEKGSLAPSQKCTRWIPRTTRKRYVKL